MVTSTGQVEEAAGLLAIDKPEGWTSHDVVARLRRLTGVRKVGHAGTLDPMATGVLLVCLGQATRLVEYLASQPKAYLAEVTLGSATDTYDATGRPTQQSPAPDLDVGALEAALAEFRGPLMQKPPAYSAIKQDGQPLYKRARRGEAVETAPRPVTIYELALLAYQDGRLRLRIRCSAGAYVRSLAHDLGQALGCGAHLSWLRRTAVGAFTIEQAITLEALAQACEAHTWRSLLQPAEAAVAHLPALTLGVDEAQRLLHGQLVARSPEHAVLAGPLRAHGLDGRLLAIVQFDAERQAWRPLKVLAAAKGW